MDVKLIDKDEFRHIIQKNLNAGWILLDGDMSTIVEVEERFFLGNNGRYFSILAMTSDALVIMCKPTKKMIEQMPGLMSPHPLVGLTFVRVTPNQIAAHVVVIADGVDIKQKRASIALELTELAFGKGA